MVCDPGGTRTDFCFGAEEAEICPGLSRTQHLITAVVVVVAAGDAMLQELHVNLACVKFEHPSAQGVPTLFVMLCACVHPSAGKAEALIWRQADVCALLKLCLPERLPGSKTRQGCLCVLRELH